MSSKAIRMQVAPFRNAAALALVLLVTLAACTREPVARPSAGGPIILISVDTLRADHLGAWGYDRVRTPALDMLASDSMVFENAYSHVPLTLPSHVSILTGLLPPDHGVRNNIGYTWNVSQHPPITKLLSAGGYRTGAAVSAYVLRGNTGLRDAFDSLDDEIISQSGVATGALQRPGADTIAVAKSWIAENRDHRFFYMLHLFEPHAPWEPPEPYATLYASNPYDGEIALTDALVGDFLTFLKAQKLYDRATIIFLSDHGEGLGDHGEQEHGIFVYREAIHVPLMIKLPDGRNAGRIHHPVQLIDVAPTILAVAGIESDRPLPGVSLVGAAPPEDRRVYSETALPRVHLGWSELRSLIDARYHYIEAPRSELYDHLADPSERANILDESRRVYSSMKADLDGLHRAVAPPSDVDPEEAAKLAALGYIGTVRVDAGDTLPDPKDHIGDFEQLRTANTLSREGRQSEAVRIYEAILQRNPRFADAWSLLATEYEKMARYDDAIDAYKQGILNAPMLADRMALSAAGVMLRTGRLDEAQAHAELALDSSPAAAHQVLAGIAMARGQYALAEREAATGLDDATLRPRSSVLIAQSRAKQGRLDEALGILLETREYADQKRVRVEYLEFAIGDIYATQKRWEDAEGALLREVDAFPGNLQAYSSLAVVYVLSGQEEKVDPILERMFAANPTRNACQTAARTLGTLGDDRSAREWTRRAASLE